MRGLLLRAGTIEVNNIDRVLCLRLLQSSNTDLKQTIIRSDLRIIQKEVKGNYPEAIIFRLSWSVNKLPFSKGPLLTV